MGPVRNLPLGTVTFMFTDIEGSTRLVQELGGGFGAVLERHNELLRQAFATGNGREIRMEGDSFFVVFSSAAGAAASAVCAQRALNGEAWSFPGGIKVRMGMHAGEATLAGDDYVGIDVHRAARIAAAAHGGQVLISDSVRALSEGRLPEGVAIRDLGPHRLKDLSRPERIFQMDIPGLGTDFPALRTLDIAPNNLPTQVTSFIGRDRELREIKQLLSRSRLLTMTGPGGTGKTRLALQVAADAAGDFPQGIYFVPLSSVNDPELVVPVILQVLGLSDSGSRPSLERLIEHIREQRMLLLLDNFEQLLGAAPVTSDLLRGASALRILVTSRSVLHVYGEQEFAVPPLRLPDPKALPDAETLSQFETVRLFIERAMAVKPDFRLTNVNAPAVAGICERVDGLPLAIELAAARVKILTPQAILDRLQNRLGILSGGARDLPDRQQTLRGAIAWSYDLLDAPMRRLMCRFSVFARGGNLEQAEAVCGPPGELGGEVIDGLAALSDHSLLRQVAETEEPRFLMLQTVREFAQERLDQSGEAEAIKRRHALAFLKLAESAEPHLNGREQKQWLDCLELDHDNFRSALDWAETAEPQTAFLLAAALWRFWQKRGHLREARDRFDQLLSHSHDELPPRARMKALEAAGGIAYWQGDLPPARERYQEALELARREGDQRTIAGALYNLTFPYIVGRDNIPLGRELLGQALELFRQVGDEMGAGRVLWALGNTWYYEEERDLGQAIPLLQEASDIFRRGEDSFSLAWSLHTLGLALIRDGRPGAALERFREALILFREAEDISGMVLLFDDFARLAQALQRPRDALRLAGAANKARATSGADLGGLVDRLEGGIDRSDLAEMEAEAAWAEGRNMKLEDVIDYALSISLGAGA